MSADHSPMYTNEDILIRMLIHRRDNYGCDAIIPSCGPKGRCCDWHDECFKRYGCRANSWGWSCKQIRLYFIDCILRSISV